MNVVSISIEIGTLYVLPTAANGVLLAFIPYFSQYYTRMHAILQIFRYQVAQLGTLRHWPKRPKNIKIDQFWPKLKSRRVVKFRACY